VLMEASISPFSILWRIFCVSSAPGSFLKKTISG